MLPLGVALIVLAVSFGIYSLYAPAAPMAPQSRRIAPGEVVRPPLEIAVERTEKIVEQVMKRRGWNPFPAQDLELAGIKASQSSVVTTIVAITFMGFLVGYTLGGFLLGLVALVIPFMSRGWIKRMRAKRSRAFADQLESTLEVMASALRAGHSFPSALNTVAVDSQSPTAEEFARVVNANRLGVDIIVAMRTLAERMESQDFSWVTDAVAIQRDTGGNLNEILDRVGETIRERNEMAKKIRAISAEGRASGWVMAGVPLALGAFIAWSNPETFAPMYQTGIGKILLAICTGLYVAGFVWMRKIVDVRP